MADTAYQSAKKALSGAVDKAKNSDAGKAVSKYIDDVKGVAGIGDQVANDAKSIGEKTKNIQQYKAATSSTDDSKAPVLGSFKKGGKVKKTGLYKLHNKERVLNPKQTKAFESALSGKSKG